HAGVESRLVDEHAIAIHRVAVGWPGVHLSQNAAVALDAEREEVATNRVMLRALDVVGPIRPELHGPEAHQLEHSVARGIGKLQILVPIQEVSLQGVDAFEPHTVGAEVFALGTQAAEARQILDETVVVGQEIDRVTVGLWTILRQVRIQDVEVAVDQRVPRFPRARCHLAPLGPMWLGPARHPLPFRPLISPSGASCRSAVVVPVPELCQDNSQDQQWVMATRVERLRSAGQRLNSELISVTGRGGLASSLRWGAPASSAAVCVSPCTASAELKVSKLGDRVGLGPQSD